MQIDDCCIFFNNNHAIFQSLIFFLLIHSCISYFIKTVLLGDNFILSGKSPFFINRFIVDIEIPINFETSLIVRKGRFSWLIMLGICWEYITNSWNFYIRFSQQISGKIYQTPARGVLYVLISPTKTLIGSFLISTTSLSGY